MDSERRELIEAGRAESPLFCETVCFLLCFTLVFLRGQECARLL